ncbi:MAG: TonB-dependent receptor [Pseudomonadota bacterium]
MRKTEILVIVIIILGAVVFVINLPSYAEETDKDIEEVTVLDEIIVTGARVETKLKETPATIDVISQKEIEKVKYRNAGDLLKRVPGIFTQNLNGEEELTSIRVPTHFSNPYTLLLIDGLPASNYGELAGGLLREINNNSIESIEIIKGPASALYGSNAIGGVINVITKGPSEEPWVRPWAEYGEYHQWRGGISGGGTYGTVGFNADTMYIDSEEWREHSAHEKKAATFRAQYAPNNISLLDFKLEYIKLENETASTLSAEDYKEDWQQSYMTFTQIKLEKISPSLTYSIDTYGGELKVAALLRQINHDVNPNYGIRYNQKTKAYTSYLSQIDAVDVDLQLLYSRNFDFFKSRIIGGMDFERGNSDVETYDLKVIRDPFTGKYTSFSNNGLGESFDVTTYATAPYLQFLSTPYENWRLTFGGRYDMVKYDIEDNLGVAKDGKKNFSRFSPKVGITYDISPNLNLFASYSQGFVVPTVSQLFTGRGASKDLDPEKADNYEVGFRGTTCQKKLKLDLSFYSMKIDDKIIVQTVDPVTSAIEYQNVGETSHRGIEVTLGVFPLDWINLVMSYSYARNNYEQFDDPVSGNDYSDNRIPLAPKNRFNARLAVNPIDRMVLELEMDVQDKYYVDDENSDTYDRPTLYNLRGSYDWEEWSLWVHALNLFDKKYATRVTASSGIFSYFPGNPRTIFVGLSYKWGKK